jgi:dTDP-4-amino-4,6-dideoxygalactose transaminase
MTEARKIQLFVPTFRIEETLAEIRTCLERGWTGLGYKTEEFEKAWCEYTGFPHAHFLNSATAGLHLAVELLKESRGWVNGDEVITTPITFVSTNHAILYAGLKPVFADVDKSLNLSPSSVASKITGHTKAVMFVGMGGNHANLSEIAAICRSRGLALILDAAHMAGSRIDGEHVGAGADVTVFSFQAVKNLPTADSGMICFDDPKLDEEARKRSWLGINKNTFARTAQSGSYRWEYDVESIGYKYNGNSVMAAMGLVALRYLEQDNAYRRQIAEWYDHAFRRHTDVVAPVEHSPGSSRHLYQMAAENRDALMVFLNANDIYPGVHYKDNRAYRMYREPDPTATCPVAWEMSQKLISLPVHIRLSHDDVQHVAKKVIAFYERTP